MPPQVMDVPVFKGTIVQAKGHLGGFGITVNGYAPALPSGRSMLGFDAPKNNAFSECDLILALPGVHPLFAAAETRDGYFRPAPGAPPAVPRPLFATAALLGPVDNPPH